jgi:uncharacterized repeat protein (TIGR01451 family)
MFWYAWRELIRNPRRTVASLAGVVLGTALLAAVLFFIDGSAATMTQRAIAPLPIDMQQIVDSSVGEQIALAEVVATTGNVPAGTTTTFTIRFTNQGVAPQHEVTVRDVPPDGFTYVIGSTQRDGIVVADVDGDPPLAHGPGAFGLNLGTVAPGATVEVTYQAVADVQVAAAAIVLDATATSREHLDPVSANRPTALGLPELTRLIADVPGVADATGLSYVDVPPGRLIANGRMIDEPVRVFAFDRTYAQRQPSIRLDVGAFPSSEDAALVSVEAARALGVTLGASVHLTLPGPADPLSLPVSGLVDLSGAKALFWSRKTSKFEDFLYVPNSIVVPHDVFDRTIVPAYSSARSDRTAQLKTFPVSEVDVQIVRSRLVTDPGRALEQTRAVAQRIRGIGPVAGDLIDNISNTLQVARDDARTGKQMFLFLGLPGGAVAAFLAAYAASVLSETQRRERAVLRVHGAHRDHLRRLLVDRTVLFAMLGAGLGTMVGFGSAVVVLGRHDLFAASPIALVASATIAFVTGSAVTSLALYLPGRRSLRQEVGDEHRQFGVEHLPAWRRWWLDVVAIVVGVAGIGLAIGLGAFATRTTQVSTGQTAVVRSALLIPPLVAWIGGALLIVRMTDSGARRLLLPRRAHYGGPVVGTLVRSVGRRSRAVGAAAGGVALVVTVGVGLTLFTATYQNATNADARFAVGADLRVTPDVLAPTPHTAAMAEALEIGGVSLASPVIATPENAVLIGRFDQNLQNLAAVDPSSLPDVAPLPSQFFDGGTSGREAVAALGDPGALLVRSGAAEDLSIETGEEVDVLLARGTDHQATASFRVVGTFERFPGFPEGVDLVIGIDAYRQVTGDDRVDFFLADVAGTSTGAVDHAVTTLRGGVADATFGVVSSRSTLIKEQSSLTALNVDGLGVLDRSYAILMAATVIGIFVFGLVLQRRTEFATLHARGIQVSQLAALVLGESLSVAVAGTIAGILVGTASAPVFARILEPLFVVTPAVAIDVRGMIVIGVMPLVVATAAAGLSGVFLRRSTTELLRES